MTLLEKLRGTLTAQNVFLDENTGGKGKYFKARFLQPGLVKYSFGVCLLEKETIDRFVQGFVGCPVIIGHNEVTKENADKLSQGNLCHIWYDNSDGWYWCDGIIDKEEALDKINQGYNVSCQYEITEYANNTTGALHNGNAYDKVILNGKPEHLAIVDKPRYENAFIAANALDLTAENEDKWITIKPNGEEGKGKHLLLKDGETPKEAIERTYGDKKESKKKFETHYIVWQKNGEPYILDKTSFENWKEDNKEHISTTDIDTITHSDIEELKKDAEVRGIDIEKEGGENYLISQIADLRKEARKESGTKDGEEETKKEYPSRHAEILYKDLPELREKLHKAKYERAKNKEKGADVSLYDKRIKEYEDKEQQLKDEMAELRDNRRSQKERYTSLIEEQKQSDTKDKQFNDKAKNSIIEAINEIKDTVMFKKLFRKDSEMNKDEMKELFMECIQDVLKASNEEDKEDDLKNPEEKEEKAENKCKNEAVDKRKLIDEVAGIMKSAGCDDEVIRTAIAKMEKIGYDESEADKANNCGKKSKNEDVEVEEDKKEEEEKEAKNKAKNALEEMKSLFSQSQVSQSSSKYFTKSDAIELGNELF